MSDGGATQKFYGKYRGMVLNNVDPMQQGRLQVQVPDVAGPTGGITLKSTTGAMLIVNDTGIYIQNGKGAMITLVGPNVTINNGALMVI
jgi:hypothetical protein